MSTSRHVNKICITVIAIMLVLTILFMNGESLGISAAARSLKYESTLFDTSYVHRIDIVMDDWDSFIENCDNEEYAACTVVVDGEKHGNTAIRAKGNTSLSSVRSSGSQRYSFKLEFDHYQSGKTLDGLDKLCLNNLIQDNTMMKDYLVYRMMSDFGVDSPLCSFAWITVNGEDWGLYLAVEGIEDSFLSRNYGSDTGELYKPDSMGFGGGRGNGKDFKMDDFDFGGKSGKDSQSEKSDQQQDSQSAEQSGENGGFPTPPEGFNANGGFPTPPEGFSSENSSAGQSGDDTSNDQTQGQWNDFAPGSFPTPPEGFNADGGFPTPPDGFNGNSQFPTPPDGLNADGQYSDPQDGYSQQGNRPSRGRFQGGPGGFGMGSDDVKLKYIDDDPDSYSNIFGNAKTDVSSADKKRLIESLKKLSEYTDLEDVLDLEEVLRYFVVHNFVCNGDSYTGAMIHNYYLHEKDGKLGMIPWDYNLAYGTFQGNDASGAVNTSIDSPVSGGNMDDRPMVGWILSDESYTEKYHELFSSFMEKWFSNGELEKLIADTAEMIRPYVEKDPTKFCTEEEFEKGVETLEQFVSLRAEAVSRQLEGDDTAVDTGEINLSDMGTMSMGGGNRPGGFNSGGDSSGATYGRSTSPDQDQDPAGNSGDKSERTSTADQQADGSGNAPGDQPQQADGSGTGAGDGTSDGTKEKNNSPENGFPGSFRGEGGSQRPYGSSFSPGDRGAGPAQSSNRNTEQNFLLLTAASLVVLAAGLFIAIKKF